MKTVAEIWHSCQEKIPNTTTELPTPELASTEEFSAFAEALAEVYSLGELIESDWFHQFILLKSPAFYEAMEFNRLLQLSLKNSLRKDMKQRLRSIENGLNGLEETISDQQPREFTQKSKIKFQRSTGLRHFAASKDIIEEKERVRRQKNKKIFIFIALIIIVLMLIFNLMF